MIKRGRSKIKSNYSLYLLYGVNCQHQVVLYSKVLMSQLIHKIILTGLSLFFLLCFDSERMKMLLTSAAYVHLKHMDVSRHTRNLSPASRAILLSGPSGMIYSNFFTFIC